MTDIVINLDEPVFAPVTNKTLLEMLIASNEPWVNGATCATQESDGGIMFWDAPITEVKAARSTTPTEQELVSILGFGHQLHCAYYAESNEDDFVVASDWETTVVTQEMFESVVGSTHDQ